MPVTLQVTSGPSAGRKIFVSRGQISKVGRTEWADSCFPNDAKMADIHFEIRTTGNACFIHDSSAGIGTQVNGVVVTESPLHTGDTITAGATTFSVHVDGEAAPVKPPTTKEAPASAPVVPENQQKQRQFAVDYIPPLKIGDEAKALLQDGMMPAEYLEAVIGKELYPDAIRFLAFLLPRTEAVAWGAECVESIYGDSLTAEQKAALSSAIAWSKDPIATNCRIAKKAGEATNFSGPASWIAMAAFWSGDSLAPPNLSPVPPAEGLTAEAITGALMVSATSGKPAEAIGRYQAFLEAGRKRLSTVKHD